MRDLLLARHGESEYSLKALLNGDPGTSCPLTETGRAQARALGEALRDQAIDLVAVTAFERVRETAELVLAGRQVPMLVLPELNEPRYGDYEGGPIEPYLDWAWGSGALDAPPGGEHRGEIAARHAAGYRRLLERPEQAILLVCHSLSVRYALEAAAGRNPAARAEVVEYATPHRLSRAELERAVALLEAWAAAPAF